MKKDIKKVAFEAKECKNIKEIIYKAAKDYGEKIAFVIKHKNEQKEVSYENISYNKLLEDINSFGTAMFSMGFNNKRIAVIGKNRYEWVLTHLSTLLGGNISVPLDKDLQYEELENSLIRSKADVIVFDPKLKELLSKIRENNKTNLTEYICMERLEGFKDVPSILSKGEKLIKKNKEYIDSKIEDNKMAILLFTSGTTAKSKAVMLSQRNIASNIYAMRCVEDIRATDTNIAFLPFHHIFGSTCIVMMLASGVRNVFPDGLKYIKQNLNEYKVTIFIGVPVLTESIYRTIMREVEKQGKTKIINIAMKISNALMKVHIDLRRTIFKSIIDALGGELRSLIVGGAPADEKIMKNFNSLGIKTVQGYGLTETSPVIAAESDVISKNGSVGYPMVNVQLEVANKDENGIGEIRVKGPNVMLGYYEMKEETNRVLKNGWFYTRRFGIYR